MSGIRRLNHAVLYVSELERAVRFYQDVLGFEPVAVNAALGAAFLRAPGSDNHHDIGLFALGAGAPRPPRGSVGLYHLAWQVDTIDELATFRGRLRAVGALVGESDHDASKSIYAVDPDGNEFEIMWAVPREAWTTEDGVVRPLDLQAELARWSGVATGV